jgi:long-chain acyl-CoA synthetase
VILTAEEWTAENGLLTAAQKLQRSKIANAFKDQIDVSFFNFFLGFMC